MLKNRAPYDAEVDAEVAKEYQRIQEEKRKARPDHGLELESVRTRVSDLEGSVTRLGVSVEASHKRLEDMMRIILQNQGQKHGNAGEDTTEPSSSAKMLETSALTSTTLVQQQVPAPTMTTVVVADTRLPSEVRVSSDVAVDAAVDANTNNLAGHSSPGTDIAAVVEDILQEEAHITTDCHAIADPAEPEPEETPVEVMDDIGEQAEIEGTVNAHESETLLEQVTVKK